MRHTFFLGVMMRVELELPSGQIVRSRMSKEDFARLDLAQGVGVSFRIRSFRLLGSLDGEEAGLARRNA